jgi:predicted protein tyrosine phosphatase
MSRTLSQINICSQLDAFFTLSLFPNELDVISISGKNQPDLKAMTLLARNVLHVHIDDIWDKSHEAQGFVLPNLSDVSRILDWKRSKGSENRLLVHCHAGISRSSAIAFIISCMDKSIEESLQILDPAIHYPNELLIKLGSELLDKPEMIPAIKAFHERALWTFCNNLSPF